jgi:hypothetical protein
LGKRKKRDKYHYLRYKEIQKILLKAVFDQSLRDAYMLGKLNVKYFKGGNNYNEGTLSAVARKEQENIDSYLYTMMFAITTDEMLGIERSRVREFVLSTMRGEHHEEAQRYIKQIMNEVKPNGRREKTERWQTGNGGPDGRGPDNSGKGKEERCARAVSLCGYQS